MSDFHLAAIPAKIQKIGAWLVTMTLFTLCPGEEGLPSLTRRDNPPAGLQRVVDRVCLAVKIKC